MTSKTSPTGPLTPDNAHFDTFCHMVIEEYLMRKDMNFTLQAFRDEWKDRPEEDSTMISWYEVAMRLRLPEVIEEGSKDMSVLENMSNAICRESSVRARRNMDMTVKGLATMPKQKPLPEIPVNTSTITGEDSYLSMDMSKAAIPEVGDEEDEAGGNNSVYSANSRGGSLHTKRSANASVAMLQAIKDEKQKVATMEKQEGPKVSRPKSHVMLSPDAQAIVEKELDKMKEEELKTGKSRKPKVSAENWIPDLERTRSLERDFKVLKNNIADIQLREEQERREMKQLQVSALEKAKMAVELGQTKRQECGCCLRKYLPINLPLKVSQKAVLDIRVKWSGDLTSKTVFGGTNPPIGEYLATTLEPAGGSATTAGLEGTAMPGTTSTSTVGTNVKKTYLEKMSERLSVVPRCYSDVPVCTFCAQFFQDQDSYRPSYNKIVYNEKKSEHMERVAKEKEFWDPLKTVEREREEAILLEEAALAAGLLDAQEGDASVNGDNASIGGNSVISASVVGGSSVGTSIP